MLNITIKQKLIGLGGIVAAVFVIFFSVYLYGTSMRAEVTAEARRDMIMVEAETAARIAILQARKDEKDFLMQKDTSYVEKHAETMLGLYRQIEIMKSNIQSSEGMAALQQLTDLSQSYEKGFQMMVEAHTKMGLNETSGLLGNLRYAAHKVEDSLKEYDNDKLSVKLLMMRRHEKDYLARGDDKYIGLMAESKGQFGVLLSRSDLPKLARRDMRSSLNSYYNDFNALVRGMAEIKNVIADFQGLISQTEPAFDRVANVVQEQRITNELFYEEVNQRIAALYILAMISGGVIIFTGVFVLARDITRRLDEAVTVCKDVARGKLGLDIDSSSDDEIGQLFSSLKYMDDNLMRVVTEVQNAVVNIGSASQQITQGNVSLSQRTENQATSLEETASSMEEMTCTVQQNAGSATEARQLSEANRQKALASAEIVSRTVRAMDDIDESSNKIADIIGTINGIAFQTNLLALNAAVEAARAGEQGRGFAVVAGEVRSLAQRSAEAAREIKALIEDSVSKVETGTELVRQSGRTLEEIVENTKKVDAIVAEIALASNEQASGIRQINDAVTQMDTITQENATLVEEAALASKAMQKQANGLDDLISFFQINGQPRAVPESKTGAVVNKTVPRPAMQDTSSSRVIEYNRDRPNRKQQALQRSA